MTDNIKLPELGEMTLHMWQDCLVHYNKELTKRAYRIEKLEALLHDASEFLDNYSDVIDGLDGQPEANDAMILKQEIDRMLENKHD